MFKIINSQYKSITGAALVLSAASLLSRAVGVIRDRVLAHYFGAGPIIDVYYASFKIPDLIYNLLIVGALTAGFIPSFTKLFYQHQDKKDAWKLANNIINITGVALIICCALGMVFTAPLSRILAPGFSGENFTRMVGFTRIMFLSPLFLGISMVAGGILQSLRHFTLYALAPIFYNLGIIAGATGLVHAWGYIGLPLGVVLGAGIHAGIQLYGAYKTGWRWQPIFNLRDPETRTIGKMMIPRTLGIAITQVNQVVITMLASLLPVGSIAVYNYANNLQAVPIGIIGIPFAMAIFPLLSAAAAKNDNKQFVTHLMNTARQIIFLIAPLSVLILLLRAQIVRVILGSGTFDWDATINTANTLAFFSLGLLAQSLIHLLARAFYALQNTKTPFVIGVIAELVSIIAALVLMRPYGAPGLALAASIGVILNAIMLVVALRTHTKTLEEESLIPLVLKISVATLIMAVAVQALKHPLANIFDQQYFWGILGQGLVAGMAGLVIYCLLCYILRVPEFTEIRNSLKRRWLKPAQITTTEVVELKD